MPPVIDSSGLVDSDWRTLTDEQAIGDYTSIVVSMARLQGEWDKLKLLPLALGVELEPTSDVDDLEAYLDRIRMVILRFEVFTDGRAFSQARLLRYRYGFDGDIRAVGEVLRDQLSFMQRCGFNQFEISDRDDLQLAIKAFSDITHSYQPKEPMINS